MSISSSPFPLHCLTVVGQNTVRANHIEMIAGFFEERFARMRSHSVGRGVSGFGRMVHRERKQSGAKQFKEEERIIRRGVDDSSLCSSPRAVLPRAMGTSRCALGAGVRRRPEIRVSDCKLWFMSYVAEEDPVLREGCASARVSFTLSPRTAFIAPQPPEFSRSGDLHAVNTSPTTMNYNA